MGTPITPTRIPPLFFPPTTPNGTLAPPTLNTPQTHKILVLAGDHVGPEVMESALAVLGVLEDTLGLSFDVTHEIVGGASIDKHGVPITGRVIKLAKESDAVLFGSVGGPEWGTRYPNPESALLKLRAELQAFANVRPAKFYSRSLVNASPLKESVVAGTDFVILRENCGGAYFGKKTEPTELMGYASDTWEYTRQEVERCAHVAAALAVQMGRDGKGGGGPALVTSGDKANVLASGRLWRQVVTEVFAKDYPNIELKHQLADSLSMLMLKDPTQFNGVILTDNTFGDMLSDQAGGVVGTLGLLPSASLCGVPGVSSPLSPMSPSSASLSPSSPFSPSSPLPPRCNGIYEPVHGSAPDIAGQGIANPLAQILSAALMLRYSLGLRMEAEQIERAVEKVLDARSAGGLELRSRDLGGTATTADITDAVCAVLREQLSDVKGGIPRANRLSALVDYSARPPSRHREENEKWKTKIELLRKRSDSLAL